MPYIWTSIFNVTIITYVKINNTCPSSGILKNTMFRKSNVFQSSGEGGRNLLLGHLERGNLTHFTSALPLCFWALSIALLLFTTYVWRLDSTSVFRWNIDSWVHSIELVPISGHLRQHKIGYISEAQQEPSARVKTDIKKLHTHEALHLRSCTVSRIFLLKSEYCQNRSHHKTDKFSV
jgi:hypothetical protein